MKTVRFKIEGAFSVPDDWEIVEHEDGPSVLKIGNAFVDLSVEAMIRRSTRSGDWKADDEVRNMLYDRLIEGPDVTLTEEK